MALYAVGDLQGCYDSLRSLLDALAFDERRDRLLLLGDLVNRGPQSLECLRFVRSLGPAAESVLGNHDLHLLACADGGRQRPGDTLDAILQAADREELLDWLAHRPLLLREPTTGSLLVHAGLASSWTAARAQVLAREAEAVLAEPRRRAEFFAHMYGDQPRRWDESLSGWDRLRFVINCFTRLRYCAPDGTPAMKPKGAPGTQPAGLIPWFQVPGRASADTPIIFGHWSTLGRVAWTEHRVWGLDSGCVWGGALTALNLETGAQRCVDCAQHRDPLSPGGD
jgi:bis(5'-nucleosyl)-tetraphosphatase (symmetrical)